MKKTSEQWTQEYGIGFYDFSGWPKQNFYWSFFEEKISQNEYESRLMNSKAHKGEQLLINYRDARGRKK